ncbi:MAG: hypothetical protein DDT36_01653 [Firmicutes bacterium]|nr:hypothetical protein [Bacillota bacterium]
MSLLHLHWSGTILLALLPRSDSVELTHRLYSNYLLFSICISFELTLFLAPYQRKTFGAG